MTNGPEITPQHQQRCRSTLFHTLSATASFALTLSLLSGCNNTMKSIDDSVDELIGTSAPGLGESNRSPRSMSSYDWQSERERAEDRDPNAETIPTLNPEAEELTFTPAEESLDLIQRIERYNEIDPEAQEIDLETALGIAISRSREHQFAEEEYIISALRLLVERHRWGPRFFNEVSATASGTGDDGMFDSSLRLVNEFRVTQRLPYGGEVSARALARATEDLHQFVSGEDTSSTDFILSANIPLLRGAGTVARESRIQSERNLIYGAREYERFRREFFFDIAQDFLDLVVSQRGIGNAERQVESLMQIQEREQSLYEAGRNSRFDLALAENETVEAIDRLNSSRERYRLSLDRFKVRLGLRPDASIRIVPTALGIAMPDVNIDEAVLTALTYRLDLQTRRDQIDDSSRNVEIARNEMLGDLDLNASIGVPSDSNRRRSAFDPEPGDSDFSVGLTYGLPLDRTIERLNLRESQVRYERAIRSYDEFRDNVTIDVRGAVRGIDRARFSLDIQERNIQIAESRLESINADPARATVRDYSDAVNALVSAEDARDAARRDLDVAILRYLLGTGQMRVSNDGMIAPLNGMILMSSDEEDTQDDANGE